VRSLAYARDESVS